MEGALFRALERASKTESLAMTTITVGNGNNVLDEGVLIGTELIVGTGTNQITLAPGSTDDTITVGDGNNTINADGLSHSSITAGHGINTITANGDGDTINAGGLFDTIVANGNGDTISSGGPVARITATGSDDTIIGADGRYEITAGPSATITAGNGQDIVAAGANSMIQLGIGADTISAGTSDAITIGGGVNTIKYNGLTPTFTVPASLSVAEEHSAALSITLGAPALGHEVVTGFDPFADVIALDTADFADFAAVKADAAQVGPDTVITLDPGDTITLKNVALSSLSPKNFNFFNGTTVDQVTITGVPSDATLSAGTKNPDGSWSLTPAQLVGLQLDAGEPVGYPTPVNLGVTVTNPSGQSASSSQEVPLIVNPVLPSLGITVLPAQPGDPATLIRLQITAVTDDPDAGADFISHLQLGLTGNVTSGFTITDTRGLLSGNTITTTGQPGTFTDEIDITAPKSQTINDNLGVTAFSDEPNSPEQSAAISQNIAIDYSTVSQTPNFAATNQSIWMNGTAPGFSFKKFLGIDTHAAGSAMVGSTSSIPIFSNNLKLGGSISLKAGFQTDLSVNSGSFNATLPFNVTLADTYNKTNNTLEIDPTDSQAPGGTIATTSPNGSFALDFIFDAMAKAFAGAHLLGIGGTASITIPPVNLTIPIVSFSSAKNTVNGIPVAFTIQIPISEDNSITATFQWPSVTTMGTGAPVTGPHAISANGTSNPVFSLTVDPIAIAFAAFGLPDPFSFKLAGVNVSLLSASVGAGLDFTQAFNLNASGLTTPSQSSPELTLGSGAGATTVPFAFGTPVTIPNASSHGTNSNGSIPLALNLTPNATLENNTGLVPELIFGVNLLQASIDHLQLGPLFSLTTHIPLHGLNLSFYDKTFPVNFSSTNIKTSIA
jgi:hypothetical protein